MKKVIVKDLQRTLRAVSDYCEKKGSTYLEEYKLIREKKSGLSKSQRAALCHVIEQEIKKVKEEESAPA